MKKVMCETVGNYGNDEFTGPDPRKGDILTVVWEGFYNGVYSYEFKECGSNYLYSAWRYVEVDENGSKKPAHFTSAGS